MKKTRLTEFISPCSNLLKAMLGCGITLFPETFQTYGILPCVALTLMSGLFAVLCLNLYLVVNDRVRKSSSISSLALEIYPPLRISVDVLIILQCLSVILAYITLIKAQMINILKYFNLNFNVWGPLYFFIIFVIFFSALGKLDKLKFLSVVGVSSIFIVIFISVFILVGKKDGYLPLISLKSSLIGRLGTFIFAFTCHQAVLDVQNELNHKPLIFFQIVILIVNFVGSLVFILFGVINSYIYNFNIHSEWLLSIENNILGIITRSLFLIVVTLSIPLQMVISIKCITDLVKTRYSKTFNFRLIISFIALTIIYLISLMDLKFSFVIDLIGATVTTLVCFIVPSVYYLLLEKEKKDRFNNFIAPLLIMVGCGIAVVTLKQKFCN